MRKRILDLKARAEAGEITFSATGAIVAGPSKDALVADGAVRPSYANSVTVRTGRSELWLDFLLANPAGDSRSLAARVIVPRDIGGELARRLAHVHQEP